MAITLVQYKSANGTSATFDSPVTAGNLIVVLVGGYVAGSTPSASDGLGNSYALAANVVNTLGAGSRAAILYAYNVAGGSCTVTGSGWPSFSQGIIIAEYSGVMSAADPLDVVGTVTDSSANPLVVNITTTADGLIVGNYVNVDSGPYASSISGYTQEVQNGAVIMGLFDKLDAAAGSNSPGFNSTGSTQTALAVAAFKEPASGALLTNPGMTGNMRDLVGGIRG